MRTVPICFIFFCVLYLPVDSSTEETHSGFFYKARSIFQMAWMELSDLQLYTCLYHVSLELFCIISFYFTIRFLLLIINGFSLVFQAIYFIVASDVSVLAFYRCFVFFFLLIVLLLQGFIDNSIKAVKAGSGYLLAPKNVITFIDFISAFFYCCQVTPLICTLIEVVALACSFTFLKAQNVRHGSSASTGRRITTRRPRALTAHPYQRRHPF